SRNMANGHCAIRSNDVRPFDDGRCNDMINDRSRLCIPLDSTIRDAIALIDHNERGIALVVDGDSRLVDTITDGDVRRAFLAGLDLSTPIAALADRRARSPYPAPVTAPLGTDPVELLHLMEQHGLRQI